MGERDRPVSRTIGDGCQGRAPEDDPGAITLGAGTLARRLALARGWTAPDTAEALERDPHTISRWAAAFGEGEPTALIFERSGGPPALGEGQQAELRAAVKEPPAMAGIELANWNWKAVRQFVSGRFGNLPEPEQYPC